MRARNILKLNLLWVFHCGFGFGAFCLFPLHNHFVDIINRINCAVIFPAEQRTFTIPCRMSDVPLDDRLDYPRVRHMVEFMDLVRENRFTKVIGPVRYIKDGFNLRAKLEIVDELEDMSLFDAASRAHFDYEHGVLQRITKKCEVCGTTHDFNVTIDAQSFFV